MKKKLLLITYYWPPCGGVAVQRWLKHVKYLQEFGWDVVVYTADGADYPSKDETLEAEIPEGVEVIRQPIWEPYGLYRKFTGRKKEEKMQSGFSPQSNTQSLPQRAAVFVRSNFFIPDARRFWIRPSVKFLRQWLKDNHVDAIASNGTPHTDHLIALALKRENPDLPWLADFRDPWTGIDYFEQLNLTPRALATHKKQEKAVMSTADVVTTVSWTWQKDFEKISGRKNVEVVTNGYDAPQFTGQVTPDGHFSLYHTGVLGKDRNYPSLWRALQTLVAEEDGFAADFKLVLIGETDPEAAHGLEIHGLTDHLERHPFLPHDEVIRRIRGGQLLLLLINQAHDAPGRLPSKLYEYLGAKRPVLAISPLRGDAARILSETSAGEMFLTDEEDGIREYLRQQYRAWKSGDLTTTTHDTEAYSRYRTTERVAVFLDGIVAAMG